MPLFDAALANADPGYRILKAAQFPQEAQIKAGLEALWERYEPYADFAFPQKFARQPDEHFWEMYLTARFLSARKKLRLRADLPAADRETGPDICVQKCRRKIWIEAIAPEQGDDVKNLDRVPILQRGLLRSTTSGGAWSFGLRARS